jgi:hypothetical protein
MYKLRKALSSLPSPLSTPLIASFTKPFIKTIIFIIFLVLLGKIIYYSINKLYLLLLIESAKSFTQVISII